MNLLASLIPSFLFIGVLFIPTFSILKFYDYKNRTKKSPLNIDLLRNPGQTLQKEIDELTNDLSANLAILPIIPVLLYSYTLSAYQFNTTKPSIFVIIFFIFIGLISIFYFTIKNFKILNKRNKLRLAHECEVFVGQDLQNSLINGFKIFHDFPANNFNIDHVAIGPSGVFAIETKGRAKARKSENKNWVVTFDGENLIFPGWQEKEPIIQATRQAKWLEKWIQESTAEKIHVTPVLALPGWFIERRAKSNLIIYNGKNSNFLEKNSAILSRKQIDIISFQIEKACRNIEGKSYQKIMKPSTSN